jgi:glutaconate CoA-transferase subunit B
LVSPASSETDVRGYSARELMVAAAAREIHDGEWVFVGMRLPLLAFAVAKNTHAPRAVALYENGVIREASENQPILTMGDSPHLRGATFCGSMLEVMGLLQQGRVHVGFLGAAEVDRFGNLNTIWGQRDGRTIRLPGAGGACDIACLAQRTVVLLPHDKGRLVERVAHITSPGYGRGDGWRRTQGLPARSGPSAVITTLGILRFTADGEAFLAAVHPGVRVEEVLSNTGWTLHVADNVGETPAPTPEELAAIRKLDSTGVWTKG